MYLSLLFIILSACCILSFLECWMQHEKYIIYIMIGFCLCCYAAFRPEGMDNDFGTYVQYIVNYNNRTYEVLVEPSFLFISEVVMKTFGHYRPVFILFAFMGVTLKMLAIQRLAPLIYMPLCIYIANFFIMHEFTQIRVGVAVGFIMLALSFYIQQQRFKSILFIMLATCFHYTSLLILPMLFLSKDDIPVYKRYLWAMIVPFGYLLYFLHIGVSELPIPIVEEKMAIYTQLRDIGYIDDVNVFNLLHLLKIAIFYYSLFYYDVIKNHVPCFTICLQLMGLSLFSFVALTDLPVLAIRISELYGFSEIILFACIIYTVKPRWVGTLATTTLAVALLCLHAFIDKILVIM